MLLSHRKVRSDNEKMHLASPQFILISVIKAMLAPIPTEIDWYYFCEGSSSYRARFFVQVKTLGGVMKKILWALSLLSLHVSAQQMNPYRVIFPKALKLEGKTVVQADKVKLKIKDGAWKETDRNSIKFTCDMDIELQGRDLATKNTKIGEHYYGAMYLDCSDTTGINQFKTSFNRVLFLGIRNCVQSETVFDQDYCSLDVVAFRKERDVTLDNGDLILQTNKKKQFYQITSTSALSTINNNALVPEGLQLATIDSFQLFKVSLGKTAQEFFIQKPDANSNFAKGQNLYLTANADVLIADQTLRKELDASYNTIMNKLGSLPSGQPGVTAFENQLPGILSEFALSLKKLLSMITPTEFFQAEKKLIALEKQIITVANGFKPTITNRDQFRQSYAAASDEYNRFSTYLNNNITFTSPIASLENSPLKVVWYNGNTNEFTYNDNSINDQKIKKSCVGEALDFIYKEWNSTKIQQKLASLDKNTFKSIVPQFYLQAYEGDLNNCNLLHRTSIIIKNSRNVVFKEELDDLRGDVIDRTDALYQLLLGLIPRVN